jgi:hypothetical protein
MAKKHWIYIKRGLSEDPKHRAQMGECIWLYMHIIDRADWETGIAFDWKDRDEAADMSMPVDTLRRQRQKLEEMDYIRCAQKQHAQDIYIMEWKNPRDYGAETKNPRNEGSHEQPPSNMSQGSHERPPSNVQGLNQGLNQDGNQVQAQVRTPTSPSKSKVSDQTTLDFEEMTIPQARRLATLRMYTDATGFFPGSILWETVHNTILQNGLTKERIRAAAVEWQSRGYKRENVKGILEWAVNGVPSNGQKGSGPAPAIDERSVQSTIQQIADKWNFKPAPPPSTRPRIGQKGQDS